MILEGDVSVIEAIKEKKRLMEAGEECGHIRPILVIDGGLMKGVYGAGTALAMDELDICKVFTGTVGVSSGAPTIAYALAGDSKIGSTIFYEELCTKEFLSFRRWRNPEDSAFVRRVLEGVTGKLLDSEKVLQGKIPFYIGLSEYATAKPFLLKPENSEEFYSGIQASISMPGVVSDVITVRGVRYVDGASTEPHVLQHIYEQFDATHILIITNQDKSTTDILWLDKLFSQTLFRWRMSKKLRSVAIRRRKIRHAWVAKVLTNASIPICFSWGNGSVSSFERDSKKIKDTIESSRQWWRNLLE
jgi:predicted patatin/cPLA2 family phospholipase